MAPNQELDPKREEVERLLRQAHLQQLRGQLEDASASVQQALELMPDDASVWEMLGDLRQQAGDLQGAHDAYKRAHELAPQNAAIERKYAQTVLSITTQQERFHLWQQALEGKLPEEEMGIPRRPGLAFLLSFVMPGLGQIYSGQLLKGGILLGVTLLGLTLFVVVPGGRETINNLIASLVNPARMQGGISGFHLFLMIVLFFVWLYAIIDAPLSAAARNRRLPGVE
ncbi:MAG: tetratricopeptide repeat protein [Armatimonadota bacterium]